MNTFKRGDIIEHDGLLAVVVGTDEDGGAPEDHLALWYGDPPCTRISKGGAGGQRPEVWTVPTEYCSAAASPVVFH
jgi:hypothetical protein